MKKLLDKFYPIHQITTTNRDPAYVTPEIKALLRRKNKMMKLGKIEIADALSKTIRNKITAKNLTNFSNLKDSKDLWSGVKYSTST